MFLLFLRRDLPPFSRTPAKHGDRVNHTVGAPCPQRFPPVHLVFLFGLLQLQVVLSIRGFFESLLNLSVLICYNA